MKQFIPQIAEANSKIKDLESIEKCGDEDDEKPYIEMVAYIDSFKDFFTDIGFTIGESGNGCS